MPQRGLPRICAYCGADTPRPTRDHVIPRSLWPNGRRTHNPIMVPSCEGCHITEDREVGYFRGMLVMMADPTACPLIEELAGGQVARGLDQAGLYEPLINNAEFAWRQADCNEVVVPGVRVPFDQACFEVSIKKIVRGLFFAKSGFALPLTHEVQVFTGSGFYGTPQFAAIERNLGEWEGCGDIVFQYRCFNQLDDPCVSGWLLQFYASVGIFAWTIPRDIAA